MKAIVEPAMHSGCEPTRWRLINMIVNDEGQRHYAATMIVCGSATATEDHLASVSRQLSTLVTNKELDVTEGALRNKYEELWHAGLG